MANPYGFQHLLPRVRLMSGMGALESLLITEETSEDTLVRHLNEFFRGNGHPIYFEVFFHEAMNRSVRLVPIFLAAQTFFQVPLQFRLSQLTGAPITRQPFSVIRLVLRGLSLTEEDFNPTPTEGLMLEITPAVQIFRDLAISSRKNPDQRVEAYLNCINQVSSWQEKLAEMDIWDNQEVNQVLNQGRSSYLSWLPRDLREYVIKPYLLRQL